MHCTLARWLPLFFSALIAAVTANPTTAQATPHPARGLHLESIEWLTDGAEFLDKKRFKTSMTREEKAVDRNQLIDSALAVAKAKQRPVLCYVYKISETTKRGRQMIRAPVLDVYMRQLIWSDPDVERIVKSSFVPVRTVFDDALCERFKVRPLTFLEPAILFLTPDGELLHELRTIRTFDAPWIANLLRDVLDKAHGPLVSDDLEAAKDRGDWQRALAIVTSRQSVTALDAYQQATYLRRLRRGDEALAALDLASERIAASAKHTQPATSRPRGRRGPSRPPPAVPRSRRLRRSGQAATGLLTLTLP